MQRYVSLIAVLAIISGISPAWGVGPDPVPLWPDHVPGALGEDEPDRPTVRIHRPKEGTGNGTAIIVCPGGGYGIIAMDHEGSQIANWLTSKGITALALRYRLGPKYHHPIPLSDAQRALRYARAHAEELGIVPHRVGIMGFSAGGHLASTAATHFDAGNPSAEDPVDRQSCRPDFAVLGYPVVSLTADFAHRGSGNNLLGETPSQELLTSLSNETQVTAETPPTFLFHTSDDTAVPPENSVAFYMALRKAKIPAELHIYQQGPHGVGIAPGDPALSTWKDRLFDWLRQNELLADGPRTAVTGKVTLQGKPVKWGQITFVSVDSPYAPTGFAMIHNGNFSIAADRGLVPGTYVIKIFNQGDITHHQTVEDMVEVTGPQSPLRLEVKENAPPMTLDLNLN